MRWSLWYRYLSRFLSAALRVFSMAALWRWLWVCFYALCTGICRSASRNPCHMAGLACPVYRARTFESSSLYLLTGKKCPSFTNSDFTDWVDIPGGGGTRQSFIRGGSAPRSKPLPFYMPFLREKVSLLYTFRRKWYRFHISTERVLLTFHLRKP